MTKLFRYDIPGEPEFHPATFIGKGVAILTSDGYFSAVTDYGNYATNWSYGIDSKTGDLRYSFLRFGADYILGKIAKENEFNLDKGKSLVQEYLFSDEAKSVLDAIVDEDTLETNFYDLHLEAEDIQDFYDYPAQARTFVERFIPRLQQVITLELEKEEKCAQRMTLSRQSKIARKSVMMSYA